MCSTLRRVRRRRDCVEVEDEEEDRVEVEPLSEKEDDIAAGEEEEEAAEEDLRLSIK